jgi:dTDP-4-dehydrorhamnose reductase
MKIAIIGADGQLGSDLVECLGDHSLYPLLYPEFDITKETETRSELSKMPIDILINTAAYNKVDQAEEDPYECLSLNAFAIRNLAQICAVKKCVFVHFSSDYVFDGKKKAPYTEEDCPRPLSVYGVSKLAGEVFAQNLWSRSFLIRTSGLFGKAGCWGKGLNFVDHMLSLGHEEDPIQVVDDQWVTPTSTHELALNVKDLIQTEKFGLYHLTNEGHCTWYDFAREIFRLSSLSPSLSPVTSAGFGARARRQGYSVLENKKAKEIGLRGFSDWKDALRDYLKAKNVIKI